MRTNLIFPATLMLVSIVASGHSGRQDSNGGHFDRKTGVYHCHGESCKEQHKKSKAALKEAVNDNRKFSLVYNRKDWSHWADMDGDCQDSRVETLVRYSLKPVTFQNGDKCEEVVTGKWYDPYTDRYFTKAGKLDIDHRIALEEAHKIGASNWSRDRKKQFANDPINIIPVYLSANRSKSSRFAYQWMPNNKAYWCEYISTRELVVKKYNLSPPKKELKYNQSVKDKYCN